MKTINGIRLIENGDKIRCKGITVQVAEIIHQDDFGSEGMEAEFFDTNGNCRNWKQRFDGGFVLNNTPVPPEVIETVKSYFVLNLPEYEVVDVLRKSDHPEDYYLYMVIAKRNTDGTYAFWSSWNQIRKSLNYGSYCITKETAYELAKDRFNHVH